MISILTLLTTALLLLVIGIIGCISFDNIILMLISIELIGISINILWYCFGMYLDNIIGTVIIYYILTISACEIAIGLALLILLFTNRKK